MTHMLTLENVDRIIEDAKMVAKLTTATYLAKHGDWDTCGFAWVNVYEIRGNTKLAKRLKEVHGFNSESGRLTLWNPSQSNTQSITAKEEGARAFAKVLQAYGVKAYAGCRMD